MTTIKTTVHNRRIEIPAPSEIPDGAEVTLTIAESDEDLLPAEEIVRILAAMQRLEPMDIPADAAAALDDWENKLNQRGIEHSDPGVEDVFP